MNCKCKCTCESECLLAVRHKNPVIVEVRYWPHCNSEDCYVKFVPEFNSTPSSSEKWAAKHLNEKEDCKEVKIIQSTKVIFGHVVKS